MLVLLCQLVECVNSYLFDKYINEILAECIRLKLMLQL